MPCTPPAPRHRARAFDSAGLAVVVRPMRDCSSAGDAGWRVLTALSFITACGRLTAAVRGLYRYLASMASCTASTTRCVVVAFSHRSWPIVVLECTSLPSTVTSKLPVLSGSATAVTATSSPHSCSSVTDSAVANFLYPHAPQYWIVTATGSAEPGLGGGGRGAEFGASWLGAHRLPIVRD